MEAEHASQLLARERTRLERAMAALTTDGPLEGSAQNEPGDRGSESLYQDEFDAGREEDLTEAMAALERAEARLAEGKYGLSIESGKPIPDGRLEARPTAERTVQEQERYEGR